MMHGSTKLKASGRSLKKEKIMEIEGGSTRLHSMESSPGRGYGPMVR